MTKVTRLPVDFKPPPPPAPPVSEPASGPWTMCEMPPGDFRLKRKHWQVGLGYHPYTGVALVFGEDEGNARLVREAPALLELARQYASECGECAGAGVTVDDQDCEQCRDIRDVIAKATRP